jgi:myosin heavy subunit
MPKEVIMKSLDKNECIFNRNTLCKVFYNSIFESVINKMNEAMTPDRNFEVSYRLSSSMYSREANINSTFEINILDIFGFENFNENSL